MFFKHAQFNNGHRFKTQTDSIIAYRHKSTLLWMNDIHEEIKLLHVQRHKLTNLVKEITDSNRGYNHNRKKNQSKRTDHSDAQHETEDHHTNGIGNRKMSPNNAKT